MMYSDADVLLVHSATPFPLLLYSPYVSIHRSIHILQKQFERQQRALLMLTNHHPTHLVHACLILVNSIYGASHVFSKESLKYIPPLSFSLLRYDTKEDFLIFDGCY